MTAVFPTKNASDHHRKSRHIFLGECRGVRRIGCPITAHLEFASVSFGQDETMVFMSEVSEKQLCSSTQKRDHDLDRDLAFPPPQQKGP